MTVSSTGKSSSHRKSWKQSKEGRRRRKEEGGRGKKKKKNGRKLGSVFLFKREKRKGKEERKEERGKKKDRLTRTPLDFCMKWIEKIKIMTGLVIAKPESTKILKNLI